jgi:hypothetical protein
MIVPLSKISKADCEKYRSTVMGAPGGGDRVEFTSPIGQRAGFGGPVPCTMKRTPGIREGFSIDKAAFPDIVQG